MPSSKILAVPLNYQGIYPCPVCRVGKIRDMPLMEAMGCDFCHEIFTVNLEQEQLKMLSRQPPLIWRWNGFNWTETQLEGVELGWGYALGASAFVLFPTIIIGIVAYNFPLDPHAPITWLPSIWTCLTFLVHFSIIVWLLIEIYQVPISAYWRGIIRWREVRTTVTSARNFQGNGVIGNGE
ncbi:hypothetical protein OGM63_00015 [Plectonema radiosum NIES-515]|uniref:DUF983 domain-containing protein n=1 Tax=Plectonema radiosum NIES-515 TaxID=2986073 RepID=A0ABT3AS31_9CYAN|nr:hypothetical protein [Plectonema radiosum]MCV3211924.1 hypothetical protein [Plectonema radiosum NIES-515]